MKASIDDTGRLLIPEEIRRQIGITPGMPLDIRVQDGVIEIEPVAVPLRLERRGHFTVLEPERALPPLSVEDVNSTVEEVRLDREREILGLDE